MRAFEREHAGQCFRVRYEQIVMNPTETLPAIFAFLEVGWDATLVERIFAAQHDQGDGDSKVRFASKIYQSSIGKGSTLNRSAIPDPLLAELNANLEALGYPIVGPDWDHTPSPYLTMGASEREVAPGLTEIFTQLLPQRLNQAASAGEPCEIVYKIVATGSGGGIWRIDLANPGNPISAGEGSANCTLTLPAEDLLALIGGKLNAAEAWLQGRLHIGGDMTQAEQLGRILFGGLSDAAPAQAVEALA
jgi:hypothetical protein